jgi:hypothetical protein
MRDLRAKLAALVLLSALAFAGGCASPVPGSVSTGSGKSITVTITCYGPMYPQYNYYFLINRVGPTGAQNARGPIPVLYSGLEGLTANGYGNGFATGSQNTSGIANDNGITDYVVYNTAGGPNSIGLWHINGPVDVPSPGTFISAPAQYTLPDPTNIDTNLATTLSFRIYVSQLLTPAETNGQTSAQVTALANAIRWLQVNIVATDYVPTNQTSTGAKQVDSMGNSTSTNQLVSYIALDLSQNTTTTSNTTFQTISSPEPQGDILLPPGVTQVDSSIDLQYWSITVSPN